MDVMNIVMYGCDIGETSGDDSRKGGYYTQSLLKACYNFQKYSGVRPHKEFPKYQVLKNYYPGCRRQAMK